MTKAELESKPLSDLHALAAENGVERFRMLSRSELIAKLSDGDSGGGKSGNGDAPAAREPRERSSSSSSRRRSRGGRGRGGSGRGGRRPESSDEVSGRGDDLREEALGKGDDEVAASEPTQAPDPSPAAPAPPSASPATPASKPERPRRRRRRRFGRRKDGVSIQDLLLPAEAGRQAVLAAESREACTALLRGVAADLTDASKGPDPVILLIDPTPEELGDWKREAPQAEIVAAGQARHANDALAQAATRAGNGEDVILLVDSLTRLAAEDFGDTETAKEFFDAGRAQGGAGGGSLTVVAAIERQA